MRTEKEMMKLILGVARKDERIRGVYMNGSKTNVNAPKDVFQDYDIVYVVRETASFIEDEQWIDQFGERLYMQMPEQNDRMLGMESEWESCYGYLMQMADGNRLDLHLVTLEYARKDMLHDRLCILLMDKEGALPAIPQATDEDHWVRKPTEVEFSCCCNEFWWILNSIGKGLWRGEIPYAMDMLNLHARPQLMKILTWYVGIQTGFACSVGKSGKYLNRYLSYEEYEGLLQTYPQGELGNMWEAVFGMCELFDEKARWVADRLGYSYNDEEAHASRLFLDCTYELPGNAQSMMMVRRMHEQDVETVADIWLNSNLEVHGFAGEGYWKTRYEEVKKQLAESEVYLYEDKQGIQGFVGMEKGYIQGMFVRSGMRCKGIGKALIAICKAKYFSLQLNVYCRNGRAVAFYEKEGFRVMKKEKNADTYHSEYEMRWKKE